MIRAVVISCLAAGSVVFSVVCAAEEHAGAWSVSFVDYLNQSSINETVKADGMEHNIPILAPPADLAARPGPRALGGL